MPLSSFLCRRLRKTNLDELEAKIQSLISRRRCTFTLKTKLLISSERFLAAEIVREKITRQLGRRGALSGDSGN